MGRHTLERLLYVVCLSCLDRYKLKVVYIKDFPKECPVCFSKYIKVEQ